ncbi:MAG: glycosyltransferase family 4 protein [Candidatus Micrarchaeota archaeon]
MRLVVVTPFIESQGGLERVILKIAQHFDARVHCIRYSPEMTFPEFRELDMEVAGPGAAAKLPLGRRVSTAIDAGNHFWNLKLDDYDVINAHQTPSEWIRNRNSPLIWYCHSPNREAFDLYQWRMSQRNPLQKAVFWSSIQAYKHFEFSAVPKIEHIFTNSINSQGRIRKYLRQESEILYPGVECERFSNKGYGQFFLYPSRIAPEKEQEYAIEAFRRFSKKVKGWKLVLVGSLSDRPEHLAYMKKIKAAAGQDVEIVTNATNEQLNDYYARCSAVLYAPINEDFGLVPLEAMASEKPCIARKEGGPRETIDDSVDGFLVGSEQEMADKMELLAKDPDRCASMGKSGKAKVVKKFTWGLFLKRFGQKARELAKKE